MPPKTDTGNASLNKLVDKRANVFSIVTGIWKKIEGYDSSNIFELQAYQEKILACEAKFECIQEEMMEINSELSATERVETAQSELAFAEVVAHIRALFFSLKQQQSASNQASNTQVSNFESLLLPKINIRPFSGESSEWPEFFQLFNSLVHENKSLAPIQKFQLLKSYLRNESLAVISGLQLSNENYELAYESLKSRYQNPRMLATMYLNEILNFKASTNNSVTHLKEFLNCHPQLTQ